MFKDKEKSTGFILANFMVFTVKINFYCDGNRLYIHPQTRLLFRYSGVTLNPANPTARIFFLLKSI